MINGEVIVANELVCNSKVKASFLVDGTNGKQHVVEIVEDELSHFNVNGSLM